MRGTSPPPSPRCANSTCSRRCTVSWDDVPAPRRIHRRIGEEQPITLGARSIERFAPTLDLVVRSPLPFDELRCRSVVQRLAGPVACIDDLIALKTGNGRQLDTADIARLRRLARLGGDAP